MAHHGKYGLDARCFLADHSAKPSEFPVPIGYSTVSGRPWQDALIVGRF